MLERHGNLFADLPDPPQLVSANGPYPGALELGELLEAHGGAFDPVDTHRDDPAFWLFSGGSTGPPKAVVHSHRDIPYTCETLRARCWPYARTTSRSRRPSSITHTGWATTSRSRTGWARRRC